MRIGGKLGGELGRGQRRFECLSRGMSRWKRTKEGLARGGAAKETSGLFCCSCRRNRRILAKSTSRNLLLLYLSLRLLAMLPSRLLDMSCVPVEMERNATFLRRAPRPLLSVRRSPIWKNRQRWTRSSGQDDVGSNAIICAQFTRERKTGIECHLPSPRCPVMAPQQLRSSLIWWYWSCKGCHRT